MYVAVTFKVNLAEDLVSHYIMQVSTGRVQLTSTWSSWCDDSPGRRLRWMRSADEF